MPALHAKIKRGYVEYPSWISSDCKDLLSRILVVDPLKRATLSEVKRHPWIMKGYDKPPDSYLPARKPIQLPLNPAIIREMAGFEFGPEEKITSDMTAILESTQYKEACDAWYKLHVEESSDASRPSSSETPRRSRNNSVSERKTRTFGFDFKKHRSEDSRSSSSQSTELKLDPTCAYHPLLSIYYLVMERQERERKEKLDLDKSSVMQQQQLAQQQYQQQQRQQQEQYKLQQQKFLQQQQSAQQEADKIALAEQQRKAQQQQVAQKEETRSPKADAFSFVVPEISLPPAVHTASTASNANSTLQAPRTRARAKTHGQVQEPRENLFAFNEPPPTPDNDQYLASSPRESHGSSNLASSLLRRFSSKRKPVRDSTQPRHQHSLSHSTNYYNPEPAPESPVKSPFAPKTPTSSEHKFARKPVASNSDTSEASDLARTASSRISQPPPVPSTGPKTEFLTPQRSNTTKKFHPNARAKSMGHYRGEQMAKEMAAMRQEEAERVPELPFSLESADIADEFFDQSFDNSAASNKFGQKEKETKSTDLQAHQSKTEVEGMPSIEFPKQVFLKGFFSVQSTSTKSLSFIRSDIIRVLTQLGVEFIEIKGGFSCTHRPSIRQEEETMASNPQFNNPNSRGGSRNHLSPPQSPLPSSLGFDSPTQQKGHWRKLSFGSGFFGNNRRKNHGESSGNIVDFSDVSTDSVNGGYLSSSQTAPSNIAAGNSDMLGHPRSSSANAAARTPLQFEIWIVRVPILSLHGVQFKKLRGNSWLYKSLASQILAELKL